MAVYSSKFATKNVLPSAGWNQRHLRRFVSVLVVLVVVGLGAFVLWRATMGVPGSSEVPAVVA
ncbi:MAG: hypothetical protein ACRD0P_08275, partial [Stackebrandtia sp.]